MVVKARTMQGIMRITPLDATPPSFGERKTTFLRSLVSPSGKTKYKRYNGAPIRYAGGKSLAVGLIDLTPRN